VADLGLKSKLDRLIDKGSDSVLIYKLREERMISKEVMGIERSPVDNIFSGLAGLFVLESSSGKGLE
jgi:CRISPR/Cas system-associated endoribonuclease Cas2